MVLGAILSVVLIVCGWPVVPSASILSIGAASIVAVAYGLVGIWGPAAAERADSRILRWAVPLGLLAGAVFAAEMLLEYVILPENNSTLGLIEFGLVFLLYFIAAIGVAYRTQKVRHGVLAAVWSALIGSLIWLIALFSIFYAFKGTPRQAQVLLAEGTYEDFLRSGMTDFNAFVVEDLMGAALFHLLLGPAVAAILGTVGGWAGRVVGRIAKKQP